jgi:CheY-like chemotaxis protein
VLVIEDEFVVATTLRLHLEALGCEVVGVARRADSGVEMAHELHPDLVLMDIGLPDRDGIEATRDIVRDLATSVIVVTAYEDERVQRALSAGARTVLTKPVLEEQLAQVIGELRTERASDGPPSDPREP